MFEERGASIGREFAQLVAARSVPPWVVALTNRQKRGAGLRRVMAGADP